MKKEFTCTQCKDTFVRYECQMKKSEHYFCSRKCRKEFYKENLDSRLTIICEQCGKSFLRHPSSIRGKCFCSIACRREYLTNRKAYLAYRKKVKRREYDARVAKNKKAKAEAKKQSAERRRLQLLKYNQMYVTKKNINPSDVINIALKFLSAGLLFIRKNEPEINCIHNRTTIIEDKNFNEASPVKSMTMCLDCGTEPTAFNLITSEEGTARYGKGLTPAMLQPQGGMIRGEKYKPVNRERKFKPEQRSVRNDNNLIF